MIGTTLSDIRAHIESLASEGGSYYVVCGRTGERPIPVAGRRFESRATARAAVRATEQYRSALRRYDPRTPRYDLIVCEDTGPLVRGGQAGNGSESRCSGATVDSIQDDAEPRPEGRRRLEFCHRVAAAIFEALSDGPYDDLETAIMDAYFDLAETVEDPDDLCLCLLESLATEFDDRLSPPEQATVLADAATQLTPPAESADPVTSAFARLQRHGLVGEYSCTPAAVDLAAGTRSVLVTVSDYAFSPQAGRLPVLPLVVQLYRHESAWSPAALRVADVDEGWRITIEFDAEADPAHLSTVPIRASE